MADNTRRPGILGFTLAQMRLSLPRLVAGGLAIAIGSAFVAATLIAGDVMTTTVRNAVGASYAQADLVVAESLSPRQLEAVRAVAGIEAVAGDELVGGSLAGAGSSTFTPVESLATDPRLEAQELTTGNWPGSGQIALPENVAERLRVEPGGSVVLTLTKEGDQTTPASTRRTLTVSGLLRDSSGAFATTGGRAVAPAADVRSWSAYSQSGGPVYAPTLALVRPGADLAEVQAAANAALDSLGPEAGPFGADSEKAQVLTRDQQSDRIVAQLTGDTRMLFAFVLAFAAIALLVAALVIANTFQVLVAQRTQTLALLRCVGALKQQLRRTVLIEALLTGLVASALGVLGGSLLGQVTLLVLRRLQVTESLPATVHIGPAVVLLPIVVGTLVTLVASLAPARAATRVAPLAALRPESGPRLRDRGGRARAVTAAGALLIGLAMLGFGIVTGKANPVAGLGLGVLGGALSFLGIIVGTVFWVPRTTGAVGRLVATLSRGAAPARLAAVNSVRNPRRTAATSGALLIGVTLVALMATGAATSRTTLGDDLDARNPVDLSVGYSAYDDEPAITDEQVRAVQQTPGIADVVKVPGVEVQVDLPGAPGEGTTATIMHGITPADAGRVLRSEQLRSALADGKVTFTGLSDTGPETVRIRVGKGAWTTVPAAWTERGNLDAVAPLAVLQRVAPDARSATAWASMTPDATPGQVLEDVQTSLAGVSGGSRAGSADGVSLPVTGSAVERYAYDRVINGVLAVVVGLLAVSVIIAVVGVANTLSLSVLERRRESATLRTIGLTRRQLRWTLAIEGMLIAGVGAVFGAVLGVAYGWVGARTVLGGLAEVSLDVPWLQLLAIVAVAVLAGLLASVLPSRGAARTSPVAALATT